MKDVRDHLQRCFVLHRRDFGNTSLILEVLSDAHGRQAILAKGAKQARHGRPASGETLQPFQPLWMSWSGRGEVKTLVRSEPAEPAAGLSGRVLYCGLYLNELLARLLQRDDPHESLFAFYHAAITALASGEHIETVLRHFELRLLREIGYAAVLDREAASGLPVSSGKQYVYEGGSGLRPAEARDAQPAVISGETLLQLAADGPLSGPMVREAKLLSRRLLAPHLGERPLKSRELFQRLGPSP
jgi:DNA repair protein RecO (recombination protein O)